MAYLNNNDGLYYTDEEFTTLAQGHVDGSFYISGELTTLSVDGFGIWNGKVYVEGGVEQPTGYNSENGVYYINNVETTLDPSGTGFWNDETYYFGSKQPTGYNDYFYYINNVETTLDSGGSGFWNDLYYIERVETTLDSGGSGFWNNKAYSYAMEQPTGYNEYFYYINNVQTTLDSFGYGFWDGKAYAEGAEQPTGWTGYHYYIDNVETTLDNNGDGEWNGQTYINGVVQGGGGGGENGGGGSVNLESGLQAFYKLSDASDSSGNGNTLTNNGSVSFASGKLGNAAVFNGTNSLEKAPFDLGQNFTVSFWANLNEVIDYGWLLLQYGGFCIYTRQDGSIEVGDAISWNFATASGVVETGVWKHYCLSVSNGVGTLYANNSVLGNSEGNAPLDLSDTGDRPFGIAGESVSNNGYINGSMDAVGIWNRALNSAEVAALYNSGNGLELPAPIDLESGLQAFYKLSDTSDSSGNGNTLTNNGNVSFASGKLGNAAVFDGSNYLQGSDSAFPSGQSARTISCWYKTNSNNDMCVVSYGAQNPNEGVTLYSQGDGIFIFSQYGDGILSNSSLNDNSWHNVIVTFDGTNWILYVDGSINDQKAMGTDTQLTELLIGGAWGGGGNFDGSVDAVGIWNRALNSAEVTALYNSGNGYEIGASPVATLVSIQGNAKFFGNVKFVS